MIMTLWRREWVLYIRQPSVMATYVGFFSMVVLLFIFALGTELIASEAVATAIIWSSVLLSTIIFVPSMYEEDFRDGSLEQCYLLGKGIGWVVAAKMSFYWMFSCVPLLLLLPIFLYFLGVFEILYLQRLLLGVIVGSPTIILLGALMAALTLGAQRNVQLLAVLMFPLLLPVLIFSVLWSLSGAVWVLQVLLALLLFTLPVAVWGSMYALSYAIKER